MPVIADSMKGRKCLLKGSDGHENQEGELNKYEPLAIVVVEAILISFRSYTLYRSILLIGNLVVPGIFWGFWRPYPTKFQMGFLVECPWLKSNSFHLTSFFGWDLFLSSCKLNFWIDWIDFSFVPYFFCTMLNILGGWSENVVIPANSSNHAWLFSGGTETGTMRVSAKWTELLISWNCWVLVYTMLILTESDTGGTTTRQLFQGGYSRVAWNSIRSFDSGKRPDSYFCLVWKHCRCDCMPLVQVSYLTTVVA